MVKLKPQSGLWGLVEVKIGVYVKSESEFAFDSKSGVESDSKSGVRVESESNLGYW